MKIEGMEVRMMEMTWYIEGRGRFMRVRRKCVSDEIDEMGSDICSTQDLGVDNFEGKMSKMSKNRWSILRAQNRQNGRF